MNVSGAHVLFIPQYICSSVDDCGHGSLQWQIVYMVNILM